MPILFFAFLTFGCQGLDPTPISADKTFPNLAGLSDTKICEMATRVNEWEKRKEYIFLEQASPCLAWGGENFLIEISDKYCLKVIEDSAESLGSKFNGKHSGTFGDFGCFSFNGNKIITCGGGGMIVTNNKKLAIKAKHLSTQAKADSFEYFHDDIGYNYRLTNVSAAIGLAQMEQLDTFLTRKHQIKEIYFNELSNIGDIEFQKVNDNVDSNWWLFTIMSKYQKKLLKNLNNNKLQSRPFWIPMNKLPMFKKNIYLSEDNYSDKIYNSCLSIPCSTNISDNDLELVINVIKKTFK